MGGVAVESNKDIEVWLLYKEFEGYLVSNYGNVISLKRGQVKRLTQQVSKSGYNFYQFTENGVSHGRRGGRLVGELFVEKPSHISESEKQINHIDGNKRNDFYKNLEWVNQSENTKHAYDTGLIDMNNVSKGRDAIRVPIYKIDRHSGEVLEEYESMKDALDEFDSTSYGGLDTALNNPGKSLYYGYTWVRKSEYSMSKNYRHPDKRWLAVGPDRKMIVLTSISDFCRKNNLHHSSVYLCLKGKQKSTKGWMFKEISDSSIPLNSVSKRALLPKGMSIKIK